jgi:hypothetical protein
MIREAFEITRDAFAVTVFTIVVMAVILFGFGVGEGVIR